MKSSFVQRLIENQSFNKSPESIKNKQKEIDHFDQQKKYTQKVRIMSPEHKNIKKESEKGIKTHEQIKNVRNPLIPMNSIKLNSNIKSIQNTKKVKTSECYDKFNQDYQDLKKLLTMLQTKEDDQKVHKSQKKVAQGIKKFSQENFQNNQKIHRSQQNQIKNKQIIKFVQESQQLKINPFNLFQRDISYQKVHKKKNNSLSKFDSKNQQQKNKNQKITSQFLVTLKYDNDNVENEQVQSSNKIQFKKTHNKVTSNILTSSNTKNKKTNTTKRGLKNMGNTCYINSLIQCLTHLNQFNTYFQREQYLKDPNIANKDKLNIVKKYRDIYLYLTKGYQNQDKDNLEPYQLKVALSKQCSLFIDWQQQDAHEFMKKLIDAMHEQLNRATKSSASYRLLSTKPQFSSFSSISTLAEQYSSYYKLRDDSYIYDILSGQIYSNIKCISCGKQSVSFQNFLDISLSIIQGKSRIEELMAEFFGEEKLTDYYKCEYCKKMNKNSLKMTKLWTLPDVLIIHLKRSTSLFNKNLQNISFPTEKYLNLNDYMYQSSNLINKNLNSKYILKGIICHNGSTNSKGHYWALIKQHGNWYKIDDEDVETLDKSTVVRKYQVQGSSEPYILFYSSMR